MRQVGHVDAPPEVVALPLARLAHGQYGGNVDPSGSPISPIPKPEMVSVASA